MSDDAKGIHSAMPKVLDRYFKKEKESQELGYYFPLFPKKIK